MSEYILFKLHNPTGLINQVMSLEIAVGIQALTKKELIIHHMVNQGDNLFDYQLVPIYTPSRWQTERLSRSHIINQNHFPHLLDLVDIPNSSEITFVDEIIKTICSSEIEYSGIENFYFSENSDKVDTLFSDGRTYIPLTENKKISFTNTLCWYSRFFHNRSKNLDSVLHSVKFKTEYTDIAEKIAHSIGEFNSVHIRLTDHVKMFDSKDSFIDESINYFLLENKPVVIITDDPLHAVFDKYKTNERIIFLDSFIVNNFSNEFKALPFNDEVVFGLINLLTSGYAQDFIGTAGSTYSGYIHRLVNQKTGNKHLFRQTDDIHPTNIEQYSWNAEKYDWLGNSRKCWWNEWKESYLNV